jgi:hypothetical protein
MVSSMIERIFITIGILLIALFIGSAIELILHKDKS